MLPDYIGYKWANAPRLERCRGIACAKKEEDIKHM